MMKIQIIILIMITIIERVKWRKKINLLSGVSPNNLYKIWTNFETIYIIMILYYHIFIIYIINIIFYQNYNNYMELTLI
jgi:hypothetical protein